MFTLLNKGDIATGKVQVELFDMRGNRILSTSYTDERSHIFSVHDLPPGFYFLKVITGDQIESFKLVVTR